MSDSAHNIYWMHSIKITPVFSISGYSRAAENTGFYCKELEMAFDAGLQMNEVPSFICLTHLHNDHMSALNKMLIDNPKNPIIFIPNNNKFEELLITTLRFLYLSSKFIHPNSVKGRDPKTKYPFRIVKLDVGQSYKFKENNSSAYYIEGLPSEHGVASISFGIYEMRRRCKQEYQSLEKSEYKDLKKNGIEFTELYKFPILCYMSDTNISPFKIKADMIFQYPTIIVECTFLEKNELRDAKKKNHIHWEHLEKFILMYPKITFILIHFSKKYTWQQIKIFFDKINKKNPINNVILWLHSGPIEYSKINANYSPKTEIIDV